MTECRRTNTGADGAVRVISTMRWAAQLAADEHNATLTKGSPPMLWQDAMLPDHNGVDRRAGDMVEEVRIAAEERLWAALRDVISR